MIQTLKIKNLALINELTIDFHEGLNILSGETGAGKSIIIGAVGLLLKEKADNSLLREDSDRGFAEITFYVNPLSPVWKIIEDSGLDKEGDGYISLKRELIAHQPSRAYYNQNRISTKTLQQIAEELIDLTGQHEQQSILRISNHLNFLDTFANLNNELEEFYQIYENMQKIEKHLHLLQSNEGERLRKVEFNQFAIDEISKAQLKVGEEEELKLELKRLEGAKELQNYLNESYSLIYSNEGSVLQNLDIILESLQNMAGIDKRFSPSIKEVQETIYKLEGVKDLIRGMQKEEDIDPAQIELTNSRLDLIYRMKKKYGGDIKNILAFLDNAIMENQQLMASDESILQLQKELQFIQTEVQNKALNISTQRQKSAEILAGKMATTLAELGMEKALFEVGFAYKRNPDSFFIYKNEPIEVNSNGIDFVEFTFSANSGEKPKPLVKIASGGELSRVLLALKTHLAHNRDVGCLVFDEVDAGIGGETANKVGDKIYLLAQHYQVICITHLPQIASKGNFHYRVEKSNNSGRTTSTIWELDDEERIKEIARMLSGDLTSEITLQHAKELLKKKPEG